MLEATCIYVRDNMTHLLRPTQQNTKPVCFTSIRFDSALQRLQSPFNTIPTPDTSPAPVYDFSTIVFTNPSKSNLGDKSLTESTRHLYCR